MSKKIVVVTGGSSGLGLEIARLHLSNGDNVCIVGRNANRLEEAKTNFQSLNYSGELITIPCNVAFEDDVKQLFTRMNELCFTITTVYNSAGIGLYGAPEKVNRALIDELLEGNFIGTLLVSTYALRAMKEQGGDIVNIMSSAAKKSNPMEAVYCAVKWGARGYTKALTAALKDSSIRVLAVYPGGMNTPFWDKETGLSPDTSKFMDPKEVADVIYSTVLDRKSLKITELSIDRR